jgi:peptidoglycan/xylan/chitin deacetylase (PgdA/CDA1 family)
MRYVAMVFCCLLGTTTAGLAASCPGNPDAIGTSRTITVDPSALPRIGSMQYRSSLPLNDHEVVLTFDDGPLPPFSNRILDTLAAECVKATYFLVGRMATAYPAVVRRIYNSGHTIGTHSQNHPLTFNQMALPRIEREVGAGIASVQAALGDPRAMAPFFRVPGLLRDQQVETYLASQQIAVWSADEVADDWYKGVTPQQIVRKAISRIEAKDHRGVLLLHDIHPATAMALPMLLKELKAKGYRIVQAVPAGDRPKSVPNSAGPVVAEAGGWPRVAKTSLTGDGKAEKTVKAVRLSRHGKRFAHRDRDITASIAARKKTKTAETSSGWTLFRR